MRVKDCMCKKVVRATSDTTLNEIAKLMQQNDVGCVPICNNQNNVVGFITDRDIITRCVATNKNCAQTKASDIMTTKVIKITPDTELDDATRTMSINQVKRLPVIENNEIVGILSVGDLAKNHNVSSREVGQTVECICETKK